MKPREELRHSVADIAAANISERRDVTWPIADRILRGYAIGRWVPVSERLPENGVSRVVRGHDNKEFCAMHVVNGIWDKYPHEPTVTHWLELDIPEVEQ